MHPEEMENLQIVLLAIPDKAKRHFCPKLQNIIREVMRLHPVVAVVTNCILGKHFVPNDSRHGKEGTKYCLPKGATAFMHQESVNRSPHVFCNNPDALRPDCW